MIELIRLEPASARIDRGGAAADVADLGVLDAVLEADARVEQRQLPERAEADDVEAEGGERVEQANAAAGAAAREVVELELPVEGVDAEGERRVEEVRLGEAQADVAPDGAEVGVEDDRWPRPKRLFSERRTLNRNDSPELKPAPAVKAPVLPSLTSTITSRRSSLSALRVVMLTSSKKPRRCRRPGCAAAAVPEKRCCSCSSSSRRMTLSRVLVLPLISMRSM